MIVSPARDHRDEVENNFIGPEQRAIHPAPSLLHEYCQALRPVCESLRVWNVLHRVSGVLFYVDLQAHYSVLGQILVCLGACWCFFTSHILKEHVEGAAFDSLPAEHGVGAGQDRCKAEEGLTGLVRCVPQFVLVKLSNLHHITGGTCILTDIDLYFTADTTCLWMLPHTFEELLKGISIWACSNVEHQCELWLQVLADSLEEPLVRVNLAIIPLFHAEHEIDAPAL